MSRLLAVKQLLRNRTVISPYFHNYLTESSILQTQASKTNETTNETTPTPGCFNLSPQTYQKSAATARNHTIKHGPDLGLTEATKVQHFEPISIQAPVTNFTKPDYTSKKLFVPVSVLDFCDEAKIKSERLYLLQFSSGTWGQRFVPQAKARKILYHEIGMLAVLDKVSGSLSEVDVPNLRKRKKSDSFESPENPEILGNPQNHRDPFAQNPENPKNPEKVAKKSDKNSIFLVSPERNTNYTTGVGKELDKLRDLRYRKSDMISTEDFFSAVVFSDDFETKTEKIEIIAENLAKFDPRTGSLFNGKISNLMLQNNQLYLDLSEDKRILKIYLRDIWENKPDLVFQIKIPELRSKILQEADIFSAYIPRILNYLNREQRINSMNLPRMYLNCNYKLKHKIVAELKAQCTDHNSLFRNSLLNFCPQGLDNRSLSRNPLLEIEGMNVSDEYFTPWNNDVLKKWYRQERYDSIKFDIVQHAENSCVDITGHQSCVPTDLREIEQEFIPRKRVILENGVIKGSLSRIEKRQINLSKSVKKEAKKEIKIVGYFMHQDAGWSGMMVQRDDRNKQNPLKVTKFGSTLTYLEYLDCIDKDNQQTKLASNLLQLILMLTDVISRPDIPKNTHISTILSEAFLKYIPETDKKSYERDITIYLRNLLNFEQKPSENHHTTINPELILRLRGLLKFKNVTVEFQKGEHIFKHVFNQDFHSHPLRFEEIETRDFRPACKSIQLVLGMWKDRVGLRYFDKDVVFTRMKDLCYGHVFPLEFCSDRNFCLLVLCFYLSELKIGEMADEKLRTKIENETEQKDEVSPQNKKPITIYLPNTTPVTRTCSVTTELEKSEKIAFEYLKEFVKTELKANLDIKIYNTEIQSRNIYHPWGDVLKKEWLINDYFCSHSSAKDQTKWVKHLLGPTQKLEIRNISPESIGKVLENYQADKDKLLIMRSSEKNIVKHELKEKGEYKFYEMDLDQGWAKDEELAEFLKEEGKGKHILYQNKGVNYYSMGNRNKNHDCKGFGLLNRAEMLEYVNSYNSGKSRRFFDRARMNQKIKYEDMKEWSELKKLKKM